MRQVISAVGCAAVGAAPALVLGAAVRRGALADVDAATARRATSWTRSRPALRRALVRWQRLAHGRVVVPAGCLAAVALGHRPRWAVATMLGAWAAGLAAKGLVRRPRPAGSPAPGSGYPSGHVAAGAAVAAALTLHVRRADWPDRAVGAVAGSLALAVVGTALDRVLLGAHHLTDVVGGAGFGAGLVLGSAIGGGVIPVDQEEIVHA